MSLKSFSGRSEEKMPTPTDTAFGVSHPPGPVDGAGSIICFSDIDGTLVHYEEMESLGRFVEEDNHGNLTAWRDGRSGSLHPVLRFPPSHSGSQGTISVRTLELAAALRRSGATFVLITGGRLTTLLQRLPFLPAADAYVCENGGRIFYPTSSLGTACPLSEDMQWRMQHVATAGPPAEEWKQPESRTGALWEAYRMLKAGGWQPDTASYTTCFRLKLPKDRQEEDLHELVKQLPPGLSTSFNLGYLDIYPFTSGKSKAGIYLLTHFHNQPENSVLLCDDDNDLPLAAVVGRVFLPSITSNSVRLAMQADSERFLASKKGGILATEDMLQEIMHLVDTRLQPSGRHGTSS